MRTEEEIKKALRDITYNESLSYGYREDVANVLRWVLGDYAFDGLPEYGKDVPEDEDD